MAEKTLKLYKASANFTKKDRFPTPDDGYLPLEIGDFTFDAKRMGGAPTIQCTIMYHRCLDDEWSDLVFTEFRGERYYLKQTPSSSKDNKDARWKHEAEFVAERVVLDNIYFFDVVAQDEIEGGSAPVSNSTEFTFFGTIDEFVGRLNASLRFSEFSDKYEVKINAEYQEKNEKEKFTTGKLVTFTDKFFSQALQEIYNVYELYYYFKREDDGKTIIYIADYENRIEEELEYGALKSLISVKKDNANYKPINRICGRGSEDNIPYYYPNPHRRGEVEPTVNNLSLTVEVTDKIEFYSKIDVWDIFKNKSKKLNDSEIRYYELYYKSPSEIEEPDIIFEDVYKNIDKYENFEEFNVDIDVETETNTIPLNLTVNTEGYGGWTVFFVISFRQLYRTDEDTEKIFISTDFRLTGAEWNTSPVQNFKQEEITYDLYKESYKVNGELCSYEKASMDDIVIDDDTGLEFIRVEKNSMYSLFVNMCYSVTIPYNTSSNKFLSCTFEGTPIYPTHQATKEYIFWEILKDEKTIDYIKIDDLQSIQNKYYMYFKFEKLSENTEVTQQNIRYWKPQKNLMPLVYVISGDAERFYPAKNYPIAVDDDYVANTNTGEKIEDGYLQNDNYKDDDGNYYNFENPYNGTNPYEHIIDFPDIKPSIEGMENDEGLRIDMFSEFAYDDDDNNFEKEYSESGNDGGDSGTLKREHPYFFGKLRKMPFNLFDHAIENGEMTVAMTNGKLGSCKFVIHVGEETQKNLVQVNNDGTLKRDEHGNVLCGRQIYVEEGKWEYQTDDGSSIKPQDKQNDTSKNEVWVALAKDTETFPSVMPYAKDGVFESYRPTSVEDSKDGVNGDTFVLLNIHLPQAYIDAAEEKLTKETLKYMAEFNKERFNFAIDFSRIFLAENPTILEQLNENAKITVKYNGKEYEMYISGYSYKMSAKSALPEIKVDLADTLTTSQGVLQNVISEVKASLLKK